MSDENIKYGRVKWFKDQGVGYVEDQDEKAYFFDRDAVRGLFSADEIESGMKVKFRVTSKTGEEICSEVWILD